MLGSNTDSLHFVNAQSALSLIKRVTLPAEEYILVNVTLQMILLTYTANIYEQHFGSSLVCRVDETRISD